MSQPINFTILLIFHLLFVSSIYNDLVNNKTESFLRSLKFNLRYFGKPPWDTDIPVPELVGFISKHDHGTALDLGCGTGTNMTAFLQAGWKVDGVDIALLAVIQARIKVQAYGKSARVYFGNVSDLEFLTDEYDLIYDIGCYHAINPQEKASYRENIKRLLHRNGSYLLYAFYQSATMEYGINEEEIATFSRFMRNINQLESVDDRGRSAVFLEFRNDGVV